MNKYLSYFLSFFLGTIHCSAQKVIFEPDNISVSGKTTHEISFTEDGQTLYFTQTVDNKWQKSQVGYYSHFSNGEWGSPTKVEFVDSLYNMSISPDGEMVLSFISGLCPSIVEISTSSRNLNKIGVSFQTM